MTREELIKCALEVYYKDQNISEGFKWHNYIIYRDNNKLMITWNYKAYKIISMAKRWNKFANGITLFQFIMLDYRVNIETLQECILRRL